MAIRFLIASGFVIEFDENEHGEEVETRPTGKMGLHPLH